VCFCSDFEIPLCDVTRPNPDRRIGLCTLAFGVYSTNANVTQPTVTALTLTTSQAPDAAAAPVSPASHVSSSSQTAVEYREDSVADSMSLPEAVCAGYSEEENAALCVDFLPADLPPDTTEFPIIITHIDDDCHIYGHNLTGTNCIAVPVSRSLLL